MSKALALSGGGSLRQRLMDAERAKSALKNMKRKADEMAGTLVRSVTVGGAALVAGGIHGRFGDVAPAGVPLSLGTGILLHGAAFAGIGGRNATHLHGLGDGFLASYLTTLGVGIGENMRKKALSGGHVSGDVATGVPGTGGGVLSDAEMANIADKA